MTRKTHEERLSELVSILKNKLSTLFREHKVSFTYLGGSWVKGHLSVLSDIDIFISLPHLNTTSPKEIIDIVSDLSKKTSEVTMLDNVEIIILEKVPLHVQFEAIKEGILLYEESNDKRAKFIENLLKYYYDHKIWYQNYLKLAVEG
jgi:predicted nucleotidyltransferase